MIKVKRLQ